MFNDEELVIQHDGVIRQKPNSGKIVIITPGPEHEGVIPVFGREQVWYSSHRQNIAQTSGYVLFLFCFYHDNVIKWGCVNVMFVLCENEV